MRCSAGSSTVMASRVYIYIYIHMYVCMYVCVCVSLCESSSLDLAFLAPDASDCLARSFARLCMCVLFSCLAFTNAFLLPDLNPINPKL